MEKQELEKLILQWKEEKSKRPSRINRPLTYKLYNNLLKPKKRRSEKDCTCLDRDTDYKVTRHIENHFKNLVKEPIPIPSTTKIDMSGMGKPEPTVEEILGLTEEPKTTKKKTTRKRRTTKKKNEGTKSNGVSTDS